MVRNSVVNDDTQWHGRHLMPSVGRLMEWRRMKVDASFTGLPQRADPLFTRAPARGMVPVLQAGVFHGTKRYPETTET